MHKYPLKRQRDFGMTKSGPLSTPKDPMGHRGISLVNEKRKKEIEKDGLTAPRCGGRDSLVWI